MGTPIHQLEMLLELLALRTNQPQDHKGYAAMSEEMDEVVSQKYLYETASKIRKAKEEGVDRISVQARKLDQIAKFLGYPNFRLFCEDRDVQDPVLMSCVGSYYSYVRRNDDEAIVLRSPLQIFVRGNKVILELKGPSWRYEGEVLHRHGCLFVLMAAGEGKMIHHVYKVGIKERPKVLQGVFSGVSTAFDPIGGRVVLVRMDEEYGQLTNKVLPIAELRESTSAIERKLAGYFESYQSNNIRINRVVTFNVDDL